MWCCIRHQEAAVLFQLHERGESEVHQEKGRARHQQTSFSSTQSRRLDTSKPASFSSIPNCGLGTSKPASFSSTWGCRGLKRNLQTWTEKGEIVGNSYKTIYSHCFCYFVMSIFVSGYLNLIFLLNKHHILEAVFLKVEGEICLICLFLAYYRII